jgi:hypothetical protein
LWLYHVKGCTIATVANGGAGGAGGDRGATGGGNPTFTWGFYGNAGAAAPAGIVKINLARKGSGT